MHKANYTIEVTTPPDMSGWLEDLLDFLKDEHLRYNEGTAEDNALLQYLETAVGLFELHSNGRVVLSTVFTEYMPDFATDCRPMRLHRGKVTAVASVKYHDQDDVLQTVSGSDYGTDLTGVPALVWLKEDAGWPSLNAFRPRPVQVQYTAGWAANAVPADVKQGIFLLATHFYTYRGDEDVDVPSGFIRLANKYNTGLEVY